ncbi:MAG: hypothetical protein ACSW8D_07500 [Prevotella sp.]|jgi:hypothetical protein
MMNEEEYLNSKLGKKNPFTVPEGYFEQLTEQVMERLPEQAMERLPEQEPAKPAVIKRLRPWLYAAACVCIGIFTTAVLFSNKHDNTKELQQMATLEQENVYYSDNYIEEEANYAMVDNQDIYACLLADM